MNKPKGISSNSVVGKIKKFVKPLKVGHAGTLDPEATGLLAIAIGEATKTIPYLMDSDKEYEFDVTWGQARSTDDGEGEVIANSDVIPSRVQIENILPDFIGDILQKPPVYSAIKVKGKRAYALARSGQEVELIARNVKIHKISLLETCGESSKFYVHCQKGTYVRSLARDMALKLGTYGYASSINRVGIGRFHISMSILLEKVEEIGHKGTLGGVILPISDVLDDIPAVRISPNDVEKFQHGMRSKATVPDSEVVLLCKKDDGTSLGFGRVANGELIPVRVFNFN